jgi:23S rRNA pseudouridine2605 synthase
MRLQKFLSRAGVASRRASERLIEAGRVTVDGTVVTALGTKVDPAVNRVAVDGEAVEIAKPEWVLLHKPPLVVSTRSDPGGRRTVYDLLGPEHQGLFHVGRLDTMSEGLLLFTNQGDVARDLLHPGRAVARRYEVLVDPPLPKNLRAALEAGIELEDGPARAEQVRVRKTKDGKRLVLELTLREGRNREIRRMMKALDVRIRRLRRVSFGPIELGRLPAGSWRRLNADEIAALETTAR